ncbi:nuclear transport factor 2 family protein [soil metagenome]
MDIETLLAESAIRSLLYRYCRGIDRRQLDDVRACYHENGTDHHGDFYGSADEFIEYVRAAAPRFERSMHFTGNMLIEVDGDKARVESYVLAYCHMAANETLPTRDNLVALRYVDDVTKVDGEWKILHRKCVYEWTRTDNVVPGWDFSEHFQRGTITREDPVYWESVGGPPDVVIAPVPRDI